VTFLKIFALLLSYFYRFLKDLWLFSKFGLRSHGFKTIKVSSTQKSGQNSKAFFKRFPYFWHTAIITENFSIF
jgi:hypothetical protein